MSIDYRNVNMLWASILAETLWRLGLQTAVICPGSRSAPLAIAFAEHPTIEAIPVLDERSASFFALGLAKQQGRAVAVICTSGTAGANMYPAVIEAAESRVPLLVLTADRPPELRHCSAGQAIDQQKLYGAVVRWYIELGLPDAARLQYLRQTMVQAWDRACGREPGPVHLNLPFREPLVPLADEATPLSALPADFFAAVAASPAPAVSVPLPSDLLQPQGIILAGVATPPDPLRYCQAIAHLSKHMGFPVLAEGLSPVRNWASLQPYLVTTYDSLLRSPIWAKGLMPQVVVQLGPLPTSKVLRQWLSQTDVPRWVVDPAIVNLDPTHGRTRHIPCDVTQLVLPELRQPKADAMAYARRWCEAEAATRQQLNQALAAAPAGNESTVAWHLSQHLPPQTPLIIANSTPVRDVEWFWPPGDREILPYVNRGANGIDGTLSTAIGVAHGHRPSVLLTGDLALLHDTNGFLLRPQLRGHLTIVLVNNGGGGIFELLPVAQFDPPFTAFFVTPQAVELPLLCQSYGVSYQRITDWNDLAKAIAGETMSETELPSTGVRLLDVVCDRKASARWRQALFETVAQSTEP